MLTARGWPAVTKLTGRLNAHGMWVGGAPSPFDSLNSPINIEIIYSKGDLLICVKKYWLPAHLKSDKRTKTYSCVPLNWNISYNGTSYSVLCT